MREHAFADNRLVRLDRDSRGALDRLAQLVQPFVAHAWKSDAVQFFQHHDELMDRRVSCALSDPVGGEARMRGAVHDGANGIDGAQPEVVVKVRRELHASFSNAQRVHDARKVMVDALGGEYATCV